MARSAWTGAINFAGFPLNVTAYAVTGKSATSFKTVCGCHEQPITAPKVCAVSGDKPAETHSAWQVSKDSLVVLPDDAVQQLKSSEGTGVLEIERFAPIDSIPFVFSKSVYRFVADAKVPGSQSPVNILWNGLRSTDRAAVIDGWIARSGSRPTTLVIHADDVGLLGNTLPYLTDLKDAPTGTFTEDEKAAALFEQFVDTNYLVETYDIGAYTDTYAEERESLIQKAMAGETITVETTEAPKPAGPDLMAAMQAALGETPKPRAKSKAKSKDKVPA